MFIITRLQYSVKQRILDFLYLKYEGGLSMVRYIKKGNVISMVYFFTDHLGLEQYLYAHGFASCNMYVDNRGKTVWVYRNTFAFRKRVLAYENKLLAENAERMQQRGDYDVFSA